VLYRISEDDYQFGAGPLLVTVTKVVRETVYDNEPWWEVEAMVKHPAHDGPAQERQLFLRAGALSEPRQGRARVR
jgi:hypothetical protein